jgi:hypothetical protein
LEGPVLGKRLEEGRLLLTVDALQGAVIDLLVDVGDTITLGVTGYEPFVDEPAFRGVRKATQTPAAGRSPPMEPGSIIEGASEGVPAAADSSANEVSGEQEAGDEASDPPALGLPRSDQEGAAGDTLQP